MNHYFDVDIASLIGVHAAIVFQNIGYWVTVNGNHNQNIVNGKAWVYNTPEAFTKDFPYLTTRQISYALSKLKEAGLVETGCFNNDRKNRTTWYTLTEKGKTLYRPTLALLNASDKFVKCDSTNLESASDKFVKSSITDINNTDINTDISTSRKKEPKSKYGEYRNVLLTDTEYNNLCNDYGDDLTHQAIVFLDKYIEEKGNKYKSHYLTIKRWVIDAVNEQRSKKTTKKPAGYDWENL